MGTVIVFNDDFANPHGEVALDGGDRVALTLDRDGLVIRDVGAGKTVYQADAETVSAICASLTPSRDPIRTSPLKLLVALVSRMPSTTVVANTFREAEAALARET